VVALGREGKKALRFDPQRSPHTAAMAAKLQTDEGKAAYRRRKWIAEPPNGWIKNVLGFRQFSLRGLHRVQAEWKLVCLALNLATCLQIEGAQMRETDPNSQPQRRPHSAVGSYDTSRGRRTGEKPAPCSQSAIRAAPANYCRPHS
jgi:hypothetical protein